MNQLKEIRKRAQNNIKKIVLPESTDERIIKAASEIISDNIAEVILVGQTDEIKKAADKKNVTLDGIEVLDPSQSELLEKFTDIFFELRKHKGIEKTEAEAAVKDPLYFATMLVHTDYASGLVAGANNPTGNVLRPAFQIIKTKEGISTASGAFVMSLPYSEHGADGNFVFADCAVNPQPNENELAEIAISSAQTARKMLEIDPVVAFLSFSTKGSASHELVDKVQSAVKIVKDKDPGFLVDGELQLDAALIPDIGAKKAPDSKVAGKANVLIFPDLQSGNIGYKLTERLAGAQALGPILQGMAKPVNDLSRGCSVQDIVNLTAVTSVQAE